MENRDFPLFRAGLILVALAALIGIGVSLATGSRPGARGNDDARAEASKDRNDEGKGKKKKKDKVDPAVAVVGADSGLCRVVGGPSPLPAEVRESSGVAHGAGGVAWTMNDSGDPALFAVGTDGRLRSRVLLAGARVQDWEDIAAGPCGGGRCLYVGDIGDNEAARPEIVVYRVREPAAGASESGRVEALRGRYPDAAQDAEAMFVLPDGRVHIVTKGESGPIAIYRFPANAAPGAATTLERVATLGAEEVERLDRITGASASPDGRWVALRTLRNVTLVPTAELLAGRVEAGRAYDVGPLDEAQGEGIGLGEGGNVLLTSEAGKKDQPGTITRLACRLD